MGTFTELNFNSVLKKDTPIDVINTLRVMVDELAKKENPTPLPDHELFKDEESRWNIMLLCDSYYFDAETHSTLNYDDLIGSHVLCIQTNFKNYDNEVALFLDWINPYLDKVKGEMLGYYRYEEDRKPTIIYKP